MREISTGKNCMVIAYSWITSVILETLHLIMSLTQINNSRDIFQKCILSQIIQSIEGINVSVLVYGQTSSGKTYTMQGCKEEPGIIPLTISAIFQKLNDMKLTYKMSISYLEIYNESINDLLDEENKNLELRITPNNETFVKGLTEEEVKSLDSSFIWLEKGESVRKVAETNLNHASSRSHTIFTIRLEINNNGAVKKSEINLVDLAGSESVNKTKAEGMRFREGANINKSLLSLSNVISDLSKQSKTKYVNFRESKLTRILQKALSGNSKTSIICTINQLY